MYSHDISYSWVPPAYVRSHEFGCENLVFSECLCLSAVQEGSSTTCINCLYYVGLLSLPTRRCVGDTWSLTGCGIPAASPGWRGSAPDHWVFRLECWKLIVSTSVCGPSGDGAVLRFFCGGFRGFCLVRLPFFPAHWVPVRVHVCVYPCVSVFVCVCSSMCTCMRVSVLCVLECIIFECIWVILE